MTTREDANMAVIGRLTAAVERYAQAEISGTEFVEELREYMTPDVVYWSNYVPSWEPLRPLFVERRGVGEVVARYDYENEHEVIAGDTTAPFDIAIAGDVVYVSQRETASFFGRAAVTWNMVIKIEFRDALIARIEMFLDTGRIEEVYGAFAS